VKAGLPAGWLGLLEGREDVAQMIRADEYIDLIIPRCSNEFVCYIKEKRNLAIRSKPKITKYKRMRWILWCWPGVRLKYKIT